MKILKKNSAYIIEIEQSEKETGRTMYNTRHELAKLITHKERLQSNWNSLRELIEKQREHYIYFKDNRYRRFLSELLDKMNELEGKDKE